MTKLLLLITTIILFMSNLSADLYYDGTDAKEWRIFTYKKGKITSVDGAYKFTGRGMKTGYVLNFPTLDKEFNTIEWRMKYSEYYAIYFLINTSKGVKYLRYSSLNRDKGVHGRFISFGLKTSSMDGKWHTFKRNLKEDLAKFDPTNRLLSVKAFMIRGSGNLDDIKVTGETNSSDNLNMTTFQNLLNVKKREYETEENYPQQADIKFHGEKLFLAEMRLSFMGDTNKVEFYSYTNENNEDKLVNLFDIRPLQDSGYSITLQNNNRELVAKYLTENANGMPINRVDTYSISPILSTHLINREETPWE